MTDVLKASELTSVPQVRILHCPLNPVGYTGIYTCEHRVSHDGNHAVVGEVRVLEVDSSRGKVYKWRFRQESKAGYCKYPMRQCESDNRLLVWQTTKQSFFVFFLLH